MSEINGIRNKIITISGEPASGKSTVVKAIKQKYEEMGFNVHIISVGNLFRKIVPQEYLKMYPDRKDANLADIMKDESFSEKLKEIDIKVDQEIENIGKEINSQERPNDIYIVDSRMAWKNIPESFAVRLTVDEMVAGKRVFEDKSRGSEDKYKSLDEAVQKTKIRKLAEIEGYKQKYGEDLTNTENYKLIVDTSYSNIDELAKIIINGEELYREGKHCAKYWASPTHFLPLQSGRKNRSTIIESLAADIGESGYHTTPDGVLEIIEREGMKFLLKGYHRVFGALSAGRTLLPYVVTNRDNEVVKDKTEVLEDEEEYMMYLRDYAEGIKYYGGEIGKVESLREFKRENLLAIEKVKCFMKSLCGVKR